MPRRFQGRGLWGRIPPRKIECFDFQGGFSLQRGLSYTHIKIFFKYTHITSLIHKGNHWEWRKGNNLKKLGGFLRLFFLIPTLSRMELVIINLDVWYIKQKYLVVWCIKQKYLSLAHLLVFLVQFQLWHMRDFRRNFKWPSIYRGACLIHNGTL